MQALESRDFPSYSTNNGFIAIGAIEATRLASARYLPFARSAQLLPASSRGRQNWRRKRACACDFRLQQLRGLTIIKAVAD
jgi:hypothetical protein